MEPNVVLPKELRLGAPATMPQSRSYMFKQQAALSGYSPKDTIQINLPRLQRSYLTKDSYLEFEVTYSYKAPAADQGDVSLTLDTPGALGLIDRIEVYDYLGSTQLESTAGFGQLVALLQDTCLNLDEYGTHWEATSGGQQPAYVQAYERDGGETATSGTATVLTNAQLFKPVQPVHGEIIDMGVWKSEENATGSDAIAADASKARIIRRRYHLPLFSFLGILSPKYAPLHNGYTIMITLQAAETALISCGIKRAVTANAYAGEAIVNPTDVTFSVTQARMCCQILELGPIAESMLLSTTGGQPMIVATKAYRNYNSIVNAGSSSFRLDLNINVASLTNVLWIMRPKNFVNDITVNSLSQRQRNFLESWYFQYGSSILPQTQGISCFKPQSNKATDRDQGSEALIELLKARHMYNQPQKDHVFNKDNWAYDNWTRYGSLVSQRKIGSVPNAVIYFKHPLTCTTFERGKFALGLDLELVSGRSNEIICGMNTNGMNTSIFGTFNATAAATPVAQPSNSTAFDAKIATGVWVEECRADAWCEYDAFVNISPGIATTISF